ncbi:TetR/AcrR family transcriptional regulator [Paenibacillus sp. FSL R7-0048]|jgi:AcrR family transcriptional regulator|uniref:TetR family transcriptional regulator n=1 Tax=Paenibacillus odorifer TaxID=189426 RepID=A0ABX3GVZ3_9BACL|nr:MULTISPECIES: TetR/AcrR family transcriptional regulator [Paenibacillus]MDH6429797.1 AcrR family transcriptional regulator [Paenibacillus sp. PastH-4]MDH6446103.1 AcrR family transcriptional regulator [Paenibacillus sp. PastF-4]MDH6530428.1 AcrR family transcriptional regulator [Paenibacillus sp. PastH-3]OMC76691.1 TetR family transcriptional regulator [Paenibacillus odorifer]OMD38714.1 TetR family transcriptional regulator [Paenibacillus odorifer]
METDKKLETKEKIMRATLELTKQEGFERITIKKIAEASSTNVALVNYYFGSKENLFSESIKLILNSFQHTFAILDDFSISSRDRLRQFLLDYLQVILQYPELLSRIILMGKTVFSSQHEYGSFLNLLGFPKIQNTLRELTDEQQPEHLMTMTMQIFGALFLPALMSPILETGASVKIAPIEEQIDLLFARYFH